MGHLVLTFLCLLCPLLYGVEQKATPQFPVDTDKVFSTNPSDRKQVIETFKNKMREAPAKEKKIWGKILNALEKFDGSEKTYKILLSTLADALEEFPRLYPESKDVQAQFLGLQSHIALTMKHSGLSLEKRGAELLKKALTNIETFVESNPTDPRGYETLALLLRRNESGNAAVVRAYAKCLELDAANKNCKAGYEATIDAAKTPRCTDKNINQQVAFFLASQNQESGYEKKFSDDGREYFLNTVPFLDSKEIKEIVFDSVASASVVLLRSS